MKKIISAFIFLLICFSLNAQTIRDMKIYVPPVLGEGRAGDSNFFYQQLTYEVIYQQHSLVRASAGSDFTLRGAIAPEPVNGSRNYSFYLELLKSSTNEVIASQHVVYYLIDTSVVSLLSSMAYNMLSSLPTVFGTDDWRENHLFLDAGLLWAPRLYFAAENQSINWMNIGLGFSGEYHFNRLMAAGIGLQFSQDWIVISQVNSIEHRDLLLDIPLLFKFVFKPGDLMLEPYTGLSLNLSLMQITQPSLLSWLVGMQLGVKAGPGSLVIDPRFAMDLYSSSVPSLEYNRYTIQVGIGYKFGFLPKTSARDY